jgi:hypothetical protein
MQVEGRIADYQVSPIAERSLAAATFAALAGGSAVVAYFDPSASNFFPVCPLYELTGFACPGCGLTRGFHALFHGDMASALHFNALIPIWAVIFAYVSISMLLMAVRGRGLPMWPTWPRFLWTFMVVLVIFGVVRNLPFFPFTLLFP